jgi:exonuclease SbcD
LKFFHLSDLHIGLKLMNRDLKEDQIYMLNEIVALAVQHKPDAIVIAGDIYDKAVPSAEAVAVFDTFISDLVHRLPDIYILLISGNHDSAPRVNCFRNILNQQHIYMIGMPPQQPEEHIEKVVLQDKWGNVNFYLLPFIKPSMVRQILNFEKTGKSIENPNDYFETENTDDMNENTHKSYDTVMRQMLAREAINQEERNVFVSHQFYLPKGVNAEDIERADSEIRTVGNIDEIGGDVLEIFDYAALGHIHKPMKVGSEVYCYCGTPLACSVSEAGQQKHILMVDMQAKGDVSVTELPLVPLRNVRVIKGTLEAVLQQACADYVTVVLTDKVDVDVMDMQARLRQAFPYLLEIRRENIRSIDYSSNVEMEDLKNPFELCCAFLKDMQDAEKALLQDVINTVKGAEK